MNYDEANPPTVAVYSPAGLQRRAVHHYGDDGQPVPAIQPGETLHRSAGGHWIVEQQEPTT